MRMLEDEQARDIREVFIHTFINTQAPEYAQKIETRKLYSDGLCYRGYLWEFLRGAERVSFQYCMEFLQSQQGEIYVFWDIHTKEYIWTPNYWKYPKASVLAVMPGELEDVLPTLAEDVYFLDSSLLWAVSLTHEEQKPGRRICLLSRP